jgi:hypothetical protein
MGKRASWGGTFTDGGANAKKFGKRTETRKNETPRRREKVDAAFAQVI